MKQTRLQQPRYLIGALLIMIPAICRADDAVSQTYFSARSHYQSAMPEKVSFFKYDRMYRKDDGLGSAIEAVGYYSESTESCDLAKFFMPYGKTTLNVSEYKPDVTSSTLDGQAGKDLEARHFNIETNQSAPTTFQSKITLRPKQKVAGIGFTYYQNWWTCSHEVSRIWTEVSLPVERVENRLKLSETIINDGGGVVDELGLDNAPRVGNMTDAFKQTNWKYGKIDSKCRHRWGVADVEVKLGYSVTLGDCCRLSSYAGFVAPTGTKVDKRVAEYVFAPVVGNNHHWGAIFGSQTAIELWEHNDHSIKSYHDIASRYLFTNKQVRSFDLIDKQWSRYQEVYASIEDAQAAQAAGGTPFGDNSGTSGINVFTRCVKVEPRYTVDINSAFVYCYKWFTAEVGYNFYAREAERVCISDKNWPATAALKDVNGDGITNIARTITNNFPASGITPVSADTYPAITRAQLDLESAAHPAVLSNILYGGLGANFGCRAPTVIAFGGSYEFSKTNTAINRWTVFGKVGVSF